jgi:hypothetical protein
MNCLFLLGLILLALLIVPVASIWSVNTLFDTSIPYDFKHLLAALILAVLVSGSANGGKR